jgi:hypothetical protein
MPITGNFRELRDELQRLTIPPDDAGLEWLKTQIELIEALKTRHPHGIALHTAWNSDLTDVNCYMFALGLAPNEIKNWRDVGIQPDTKTGFIGRLLESKILTSCASGAMPQDGLVFYFTAEGRPMHAGRCADGVVISKWGDRCTHIWRHGLWEVPSSYGETVQFFETPSPGDVAKAYITWAKAKWGE